MPIEIRELIVKVKIVEAINPLSEKIDLQDLRDALLKDCKKEILKQLNKINQR